MLRVTQQAGRRAASRVPHPARLFTRLQPGTALAVAVALLSLALFATGTTLALERFRSDRAAALAQSSERASTIAARFDQFFRERLEYLDAIALAPVVQTGSPEEIKRYFERVVDGGSTFSGGLSLIGTDGIMVLLSGFPLGEPPVDLSDRDYVRAVLSTGKPFLGDAIVGRRSGDPLLTIAVPVRHDDGRLAGVLAGTIRIDLPAGGLAKIGAELDEAVIVDRSGQVVVDRGTVHAPRAADPSFLAIANGDQAVHTDARAPDGSGAWVAAPAAIGESGWRAVVLRDQGAVFAAAQSRLLTDMLVLGLIALIGGAAAAIAAHRLDRTVRLERQSALRAEAQLRSDLQRQDELLGLVAHELRTPLTVILGNTEAVTRRHASALSAAAAECFEEIHTSARRLQRLLENMLVLSQVAADAPTDIEPQVLSRVLNRTVADFRARYPDQDLRVDVPPSLPVVLANRTFVDQIAWNLLTNAVKYGSAPILLAARRNGDLVETAVSDAGPGMSDDDVTRVFDPHFRASRTRARASGLGLGLSVCRRLVERQGGTIVARRNEGGGMTFTFTLPALAGDDGELA